MFIKSYAKVNLSLKITGQREDGYHLLEMVNLPVDFHDTVEITRLPRGLSSHVVMDDPHFANLRENLALKALNAMREAFGFRDSLSIKIHKEIPAGAGLGGGSSNAAAVIQGINDFLHLHATKEQMKAIGLTIGTDVPFFFDLVPAKVTGIGEEITPIKIKKDYYCLLVKPEASLSTKMVYEASDFCQKYRINTDKVIEGLENGDDSMVEMYSGNDLLPAAEKLVPEIGEIFGLLKKEGFHIMSMTGSGSTLFALSTDQKKLKKIARKFENYGYMVEVTKVLK